VSGGVGLSSLSERELEVLREMAHGRSNSSIAEVLAISTKTVEATIGAIFTKLDLDPRGSNRRVLAAMHYVENAPLDRVAGHVPGRLTSFVGRTVELAELEHVLRAHQRVTLTGLGGSGKSSMAWALAQRGLDAGWRSTFVDLTAATNRLEVIMAACRSAGVVASSEISGGRRLAHVLAEGDQLLVLDNAELVPAAVADIVQELAMLPGLRVLVTSRDPLGTDWERTWAIPPLSRDDARDLLRERMSGTSTSAERQRLCRAADGVPLAIELLAAQCDQLGAHVVVQRLGDLDVLLTRAGRDRHANLFRILHSAHDGLSPPAQRLLWWLTVFGGGFTSDHVEHVGAALGLDAVPLIPELLATGLLASEDGPRYRMLEPVRQFASAHLESEGEATTAESALVQWAVDFVRQHSWDFVVAADQTARQAFDRESVNVELAFSAALRHDDRVAALRLLGGVAYYWSRHRPATGAAYAIAAERLVKSEPPSRRRAAAALGAAILEPDQDRAEWWRELALVEFHSCGDERGEVLASYQRAMNAGRLATVEEALELTRGSSQPHLEGWLLIRKAGLMHRDGADAAAVLATLQEAEQIGQRLANQQLTGGARLGRAGCRLAHGVADDSVGFDIRAAMDLIGATGDPALVLEANCLLIELHLLRNDLAGATAAARGTCALCEAWVADSVVTSPARIARVVLLAAATLQRTGHEEPSGEILLRAGNLPAVVATSEVSGERYPLADAVVADLVVRTDATDVDLLPDLLRLAIVALGEEEPVPVEP
jgi:predicted ATPase/DNA-binding CsgD family transcriptional regulator